MKKKGVLHVLASNSYSGAENVVCTIIENNNKYDMYYCSPSGPIEETLKEKNISYIPIKKLKPSEIKRVCKENNIDIIHAHDFKASFICAISSFKGKIISHIHSNISFIKKWNIFTILYSIVSKRFHKVALVSKSIIEESVFKNKIKNKAVIINNVVDCKKVKKLSNRKFNTTYDVLFVGRLVEPKNPIIFIEIVKELVKSNKNIKAVMIGSGEYDDMCRKKISEYNLTKNIDMVGFQSNPFNIINNTKLVIMPSIFEGFGLTAIESMCLNKPVLNSGVGGLGTIFKNNKEFICKTKDEYVSLCKELFSDKKKFEKYKNNCPKIIEPYINVKKWEEKIYSLYK